MATVSPGPFTTPHQPGKSWVVLDQDDGTLNITLPLGFGKVAIPFYILREGEGGIYVNCHTWLRHKIFVSQIGAF